MTVFSASYNHSANFYPCLISIDQWNQMTPITMVVIQLHGSCYLPSITIFLVFVMLSSYIWLSSSPMDMNGCNPAYISTSPRFLILWPSSMLRRWKRNHDNYHEMLSEKWRTGCCSNENNFPATCCPRSK